MAYLVGIDVGTGGVRALVVREDGAVVGAATAEYPLYTPQPQWAEQAPADWWRATQEAVRGALSQSDVPAGELRGLGLSGQMHGLVLLDERQEVLRPAILWCDQRTQAQCDQILDRVGRARLIEIACNPPLTGFTAPKFLWVREHEPAVYERARTALLPKDYVRFLLTGEFATEVSDASGTLLLDVPRRRWSDELLARLEIDRSLLPDVYESPEVSARVTRAAADATGLPERLPVVGGGGDQAAGGVGNGIVRPGLLSSTIGSSGVLFAYTEQPLLDPEGRLQTFCHAVPMKWHVMGVTQAAGLSLRWVRDQLADAERAEADRSGRDPYDLLVEEAEQAVAGCEGLQFLPYLMGERAPHLDPDARGGWMGLTARHTRADLIRAVLEGVTYSLRDCLELLREIEVPVEEVRASGGGARSALWRQLQADVFGLPVSTINVQEGPAYGVALLAGVGTGVWSGVAEACAATIRRADTLAPDAERVRLYEHHYALYRSLYPALRDHFKHAARLARTTRD